MAPPTASLTPASSVTVTRQPYIDERVAAYAWVTTGDDDTTVDPSPNSNVHDATTPSGSLDADASKVTPLPDFALASTDADATGGRDARTSTDTATDASPRSSTTVTCGRWTPAP